MRLFFAFFAFLVLIAQVAASDAIAAYRSNTGTDTLSSPKIRFWNSSGSGSWGSEIELATAGSPVREAIVKYSPTGQKAVLVTLSDDGMLDAYACFTGCDSASSWTVSSDIGQVWSSAPATHARMLDTAYETATGDLLVVYSVLDSDTTHDLAYKVLPNASSSFTGITEQYIDDVGHSTDVVMGWVTMDANPSSSSQEMIVAATDRTDNDINAWVWDGDAWGNEEQLANSSTATGDYEALAVRYNGSGSQGMVAGGDGANGVFNYAYWGGSSWSSFGTFDITGTGTDDIRWMELKSSPASGYIMMSTVSSGSDLDTVYWNGASWTGPVSNDGTVDAIVVRPANIAWNGSSSIAKLVWDTDTTGTTLSQRSCSPACASTGTISTYAGTGAWLTLYRNPNATDTVKILGLRLNSNSDIGSFYFDGAGYANYDDAALTADTTVTTFEAYSLSFLLATDSSGPSVTSTSVNSTSVSQNDNICVNATTNDLSGVSAAWAQITFPNGTITNFTMDESGCNAGTAGDLIYGVSINVGATAGSLVVNTSFANDSFDNTGLQSPYPNIQVTISAGGAFVDTSIDASTISFGPLDPARFNMNASENPINLTNTGNSNVAVDVYLNTTKMTSGANTMNCNNLSVSSTIVNLTSTNFSCSLLYINGTSANQGFYENVAISSTVKLYFWHDVPPGQASGSYTATVRVHSVADGNAP